MPEHVDQNSPGRQAAVGWPGVVGQAADALRARDWSTSPIGSIKDWPCTLRTSVGIALGSPVASSVVWGSQFVVFFNDPYAALLDERPESLGTSLGNGPIETAQAVDIFDMVRRRGSVTLEGRPWSTMEQSAHARRLMTYYTPLLDDMSCVAGIFAITIPCAGSNDQDTSTSAVGAAALPSVERQTQAEDHVRQLAQANASLRAETAERKQSEEARLRLLRRLVISQEEERRRIARDLHDHLGQQLTSLGLKIGALKSDCASLKADKSFTDIEAALAQLDRDVDFLAWELRPGALDELGLARVLENYIREWERYVGIRAQFHAQELGPDRIAPELEATLYRVAQEALNNIAKHANARSAAVVLERRGETVRLVVEDDGVGFCPGDGSETMIGLLGMRERIAMVGGTLDIEPTPGGGTTVIVRVPLSLTEIPVASSVSIRSDARAALPTLIGRQEPGLESSMLDVHERLKELQRAVAARDEFIATVAHELRNPIAPLMFQVRLAIDKTQQMDSAGTAVSPEWATSQLRRIEQRLHRVLETLDRLLDVSRLSSGRIDLELEHVDMGACVREVLSSFEAELAVARCELRFSRHDGVTGWWDCLRLDQICRNLVSNAIRFGAGRPIDVSIDADDQYAIFEVRDQGIGIPPEEQEQIFERFERGGSEKRSGGFGIGLWVAKNICAAMGGTIAVESAVGRGARFTVVLPRRQLRESDRPEDKE